MAIRSRSLGQTLRSSTKLAKKKSELNKYQIFQSQNGKRPYLHLKETISGLGLYKFSFLQILNNASVPHISTKLLD